MGSPTIFSGRRTKLLTGDGLLNSDGSIIDNNGVKNYITNGHAEVNALGWTLYSNAAAARPVNGSGGAPSVTFTRSTTAPFDGQASFIFTSPGAVQGHGAAYDFAISVKDRAKVLQISFDYLVNSGTFSAGTSTTDSDIIVDIYDTTNNVIIEPSSIKLLSNSSSVVDKFQATFQTASNSGSYRLILHSATSSAAFSLKMKNFSVSPSVYVFGTPITDWQTYTPTFVGCGTVTNISFRWRRVGDSLQIAGACNIGVATATAATFTFPAGLTIDTAKSSTVYNGLGEWIRTANASPSTRKRGKLIVNNASGNLLYFSNDDYTTGSSPSTGIAGNLLFSSEDISVFAFNIPILGWSSSVQMSDQADTRVVDLVAQSTGGQALTANTTNMTFTSSKDSHGAFNGTTYTIPVAGDYQISLGQQFTSAVSAVLSAYVNGTLSTHISYATSSVISTGSAIVPNLKTGDLLTLRSDTAATTVTNNFKLSISRLSGPSAIAASETIAMSVNKSTAQTLTNNVTTELVNYDSSGLVDTHGGMNLSTGRYTVQSAGLYKVTALAFFVANATGYRFNQINKNGGLLQYGSFTPAATGDSTAVYVHALFRCVAGDYISQSAFQGSGGNLDIRALASGTNLIIERIGK